MRRVREVIEAGLAARMSRDDKLGQIKVRQPLSNLTYSGGKLDGFYEQIIMDEVNVKNVHAGKEFTLDKRITPELRREGRAREVIRFVQKARKDAGLNVDDRIVLGLKTSDAELQKAIDEWRATIEAETLTVGALEIEDGHQAVAKIDEAELKIKLRKEQS
jgi:isoleucyl-tRNA synthetase